MDTEDAIAALAALAQKTRLDTFRLLVRHEPEGVPAGEVARLVGVPQNTMSTHLSVLARAGLVSVEQQGRNLIYRADFSRMNGLLGYLTEHCCQGTPCEVSEPGACAKR